VIFFVAGTGTGIGKTVVSSALFHGFCRNQRTRYFKPLQTGPQNEDTHRVAHYNPGMEFIPSLHNFASPASPDQAWRDQLTTEACPEVTVAGIVAAIASQEKHCEILIVEAAGGLLVPLNEANETWIDVLQHLNAEIILVASSQLGTLNHSQLSIACLNTNGIDPLLLVLSGASHARNLTSLRRINPGLAISEFPIVDDDATPSFGLQAARLASDTWQAHLAKQSEAARAHEETANNDQKYVWHPFTQHALSGSPLTVDSAKGICLRLADGRQVIDGISSWWVNSIGHGRREIAQAIAHQQQKLDHVHFAGITHAPAANLAETLIQLAGENFSKVFFSDNGSTAVEVAIKMAYQSFYNRGDKHRRKFLCVRGSYHGDTVGAMALGADTGFHTPYESLFFPCRFVDPLTTHASPYSPGGREDKERLFQDLEQAFKEDGNHLCAVVIEPLLQGAGGMLMQEASWTLRLCELAKQYGIPVIFDEVFTGLGRLGSWFAFQRLGFCPDILCIAKGLTGGNLPLSATITSNAIFHDFLSDRKQAAFLHGHSFTANPIACAAAQQSLAIMAKEKLSESALELEKGFQSWLNTHAAALKLRNPRTIGGVVAFECPGTETSSYFDSRGQEIATRALENGLLIRPLGNTIYLAPPLVTTKAQQTDMLERLTRSITQQS
jgi:adenosylmethionine---8-amino-7-oxononanoate aminotransferase